MSGNVLVNPPGEEQFRTGKENWTPTKRLADGRSPVPRSPFRSVGPGQGGTPPRSSLDRGPDPLTPTANFKMLSAVAASLEYVGSDSKSNASSSDCEIIRLDESSEQFADIRFNGAQSKYTSRKERSLSSICTRFLSLYPEFPDETSNICISIDEVASDLGVERRRMYDIVNVLESVDIVRKVGKNRYQYFGRRYLLPCLKALYERAVAGEVKNRMGDVGDPANENFSDDPVAEMTYFRGAKTLGAISQKFLMLFFIAQEPCSVSLQIAAQILLGAMKLEKDTVQFKTKIRRLYDIANIFVSIGLIEKDPNKNKQFFKYIGPDVAHLKNLPSSAPLLPDSASMIDDFAEFEDVWGAGSTTVVAKSPLPRTRSECWNLVPRKKAKTLVRQLSLHDICAAAEVEREKMNTSVSVPPSPVQIYPSRPEALSRTILRKPLFPNLVTPNEKTFSLGSLSSSSPAQNFVTKSVPAVHRKPHVCKLVKKETALKAEQFGPVINQNMESKSEAQKVISLTPEQKKNILKFLDVSLQDGQVATILISGNSNGVKVDRPVPVKSEVAEFQTQRH